MIAGGVLAAAGRRLARAAALLLAVSALLFAGTAVLPGDPETVILGAEANPSQVAQLREDLRLDEPAPVRYAYWLGDALRGDLGQSVGTERSVTELIGDRLGATLTLGLLAFGLVVAISLALGLWLGSRPGGVADKGVSTGALLLLSAPEFVVAGLLLQLIAFQLDLVPAVSLIPAGRSAISQPELLVLPVLSLALSAAAWATRLVRAAVLDAHRLPHVEAARLAGIGERRVLVRHLLPSALAPVAQAYALLAGFVVGGTVIVESVFSYPGLGTQLVEAVGQRNVYLVQGLGLLMAGAVILSFLAADLIGLAANPASRRRT